MSGRKVAWAHGRLGANTFVGPVDWSKNKKPKLTLEDFISQQTRLKHMYYREQLHVNDLVGDVNLMFMCS